MFADLDPPFAHTIVVPSRALREPSLYRMPHKPRVHPLQWTLPRSPAAPCAPSPPLDRRALPVWGPPWMSLVTTAVHAPPLASCAPAPCPLNAPSPAFAEKPEAECTPTSPLNQMNLPHPSQDSRAIEVLVNGLPLRHGAQVAADATLVSPVGHDGMPHRRADTHPRVAVQEAARRKRTQTYPEFHNSPRFGLEIGGRWSIEAVTLIRQLALAKTRSTPRWARQQAARAGPALGPSRRRSLLELPLHGQDAMDYPPLPSPPFLLTRAGTTPPVPSRLPP